MTFLKIAKNVDSSVGHKSKYDKSSLTRKGLTADHNQ